jgi:hypothetical protein
LLKDVRLPEQMPGYKKMLIGFESAQKKTGTQRAGIAAGGIFYNVQPGTAAQLKTKVEVNN